MLVIEDNGPNLELMTYLLNAFGHATVSARDGEQGLTLAQRGGFDIVVCDIQLPKLDGFEIAHAIRHGSETAALPLVAVTAFAQVGDREKVLAAGFDGYISKPIVPETFVSEVEAYLAPELRAVLLPTTQAAAETIDPLLVPTQSAAILVVDNVEANLELMRSLLGPFGYRVSTATGVEEALRSLAEATPDLIVCDLHLLDGTGYDLLAALKKSSTLQAIPFLFLSSTARGADEQARGLAFGARKFIVRPIDAPSLLAEIEDCLRKS